MDVPIIAAVTTFVAVIVASSALFGYLSSRSAVVMWRRRVAENDQAVESEEQPAGFGNLLKARCLVLLEWLGRMNRPSKPKEMYATRRLLINAGYRSGKATIVFLGSKLLLALASVLLCAMVPVQMLGFPSASKLIFYYVLAATCGYYGPGIWLRRAIESRKQSIQRAIPDALDLMVVCVEAGLGLDQAIGRVGEEIKRSHPELSDELAILAVELRTGLTRQEALKNLAARTDLEEMRHLVAILVQTERFGTSIGQALRVHADSMRTTRRLKAEELAAKLPVKLLFPLIFFIFPSMFIVVIGPACIKMMRVFFPALSGQ